MTSDNAFPRWDAVRSRLLPIAALPLLLLALLSLPARADAPGKARLASPTPVVSTPLGSKRHVEGEVVVRFRPGVGPEEMEAVHARQSGSRIHSLPRLRLHRVRLSPGRSVADAVRRYREDPRVQYAEPNMLYSLSSDPNDPRLPELWGLRNTGHAGGGQGMGFVGSDTAATRAWDNTTGEGVVVAVIDTGAELTHEDLVANLWVNPGEIPDNGIDDDGNGYVDDVHGINSVYGIPEGLPRDGHGHGTHVAGTIGAVGNNGVGVVGVAWNIRIMPLKMMNDQGIGTAYEAAELLEYIREMKARGVPIVAVNNSWGGGGYSEVLRDAIAAIGDILFVASAGNGGEDGMGDDNDRVPSYPAGYDLPNVIAVAATDRYDMLTKFSNYGPRTVHIAAPGSEILSAMSNTNIWGFDKPYVLLSGTSMAAPHVTGVAALLKAAAPSRTGAQIRNLILAGGNPVPGLAETTVTGRRLDAAGSLACANSPVLAALSYPSPPEQGVAATVSAMSIDCDRPAGPVWFAASTGERFELFDDGVAPDAFEGDGVFSGSWTPSASGAVPTFASPSKSVRVDPPFHIAETSLPRSYDFDSYSTYAHHLVAVNGTPPFDWTMTGGSLPPGLFFDNVFQGVRGYVDADEEGDYSFEVQVSDAEGRTASGNYSLMLRTRVNVRTKLLPDGIPGAAYACVLEAGGGHPPYTWDVTSGTLPDGLALDRTGGRIHGVPTRAGSFEFTLQVSDGLQPPAGARYRVGVTDNVAAAWLRVHDASRFDAAAGIAAGADGSVYVAGQSFHHYRPDGGDDDFLTVRYDREGRLAWARTFESRSGGDDRGKAVATDRAGNAVATGIADLGDVGSRILLLKYRPDGELLWSGNWPEVPQYANYEGRAVATDAAGNVYVGGHGATGYSRRRYVVLKYDPAGSLLWSRELDGNPSETFKEAGGIGIDAAGNVYLTGGPTFNGVGNYDVETFKLDPDGTLLWQRRYDSGLDDFGYLGSIAVSPAGDAYVAAGTKHQYMVLKYDPDGNLALAWRYPEVSDWVGRYVHAIALDGNGGFYVTGSKADDNPFERGKRFLTVASDASGNVRWSRYESNSAGLPPDTNHALGAAMAPDGTLLVTGTVDIDAHGGSDIVTIRYIEPGADGSPTGILSVLPTGGPAASGDAGGPFSPATTAYTLSNAGSAALDYSVSTDVPWLGVDPASGTIPQGGSATVAVAIDAAAAATLPAGRHDGSLAFTNRSGGVGSRTLAASLDVLAPATLSVTPAMGLAASGLAGGTFLPANAGYTLTNEGGHPLAWSASRPAAWVSVSPASGTLGPSESTVVTVAIDCAAAAAMGPGTYSAVVPFTNATNGAGSTSRAVSLAIVAPARLDVSPASGLSSSGPPGGPFSPAVLSYAVANPGGAPLAWTASVSQTWVTLSSASGTLQAGESTSVDLSIQAAAELLPAGSYGDTVVFANATNGDGSISIPVVLSVRTPASLEVSPGTGFQSTGPPGGPFSPATRAYTLRNGGGQTLSWTAVLSGASWAALSRSGGTLAPGATASVDVSILDAAAAALSPGTRSGQVSFTNVTNGVGNAVRGISLSVDPATDSDGDGAPDAMERGPEGTDSAYDGNVDGSPDWAQDNTASVRSVDGAHYVTIACGSGLRAVRAEDVPPGIPEGVRAPYGFFSWRTASPSATGRDAVRIYLDGEFPNAWYMHGARTGTPVSAYGFPARVAGGAGAEFAGFEVTLWIDDGGLGDGDLEMNGTVAGFGGPAVNPAAPPNTGGAGGGGGCSASGAADSRPGWPDALLVLLTLALASAGRRRTSGSAACRQTAQHTDL